MCLIFFAYDVWDEHALVVAANRDEFHGRRSATLHAWDDNPAILAGRDLEAGGTWLGLHKRGRFAAVTNFRSGGIPGPAPLSRGHLVTDFLQSSWSVEVFIERLRPSAQLYNGFNLLLFDGVRMGYFSNRTEPGSVPELLTPGVYGLSNHLLDTPWPKVVQGKAEFERLRAAGAPGPQALFDLLSDRRRPDDAALPSTGVDLQRERNLAPRFIVGDSYGTRCSSVVLLERSGRVAFHEQSYDATGRPSTMVSLDDQLLASPQTA
ncbi:MAG: NRDE family protein [Gammaproteobacteria bacterium]|nr:NRDE family protein [Gammaproteobacteria bacterium]